MESITVGQIVSVLAIIVSLIGSIKYLKKNIETWVISAVKNDLDEIKEQVTAIRERVDDVDLESCKNFLTAELTTIEQGGWWSDVESLRFWEQYEHYKKLGGNTYIQQWVEKLQKDNKI